MTADNITNFGYSSFERGVGKVTEVEATSLDVQRFNDSYQRIAQVNPGAAPTEVQSPAAVEQTRAAAPVDNTVDAAQERARRALGLEGSTAQPAAAGDKILDGLDGLRKVIDTQQAAVARHAGKSEMDMMNLVTMQLEVTKYSLLVDVTSKLAGKSTQTFDSLLKNQ